jgi:bifunctional non-homologous end joining protein LigD
MGLKEYQAKRNFKRTREPAGKARHAKARREPRFVVQKHAARQLHYDFRLEMDGVLKSWAVPKGFPMRKGDRRLAVQVEDHPLEYGDFEGTIPEGNYGAGTVMVWDYGTYEVDGDPLQGLREGKLHFTLKGKKLQGEWALVRMRSRENEDKPQWLLLKSGSDMPALPASADKQSALSRRTMEQIAASNDRQWQSNRARAQLTTARRPGVEPRSKQPSAMSSRQSNLRIIAQGKRSSPKVPDLNLQRLPSAKAEFVEPMKALLADRLPRGPEWIYEIKFDGVRALAIKRGNEVRLVSRTAKDLTAKYPELAQALKRLPSREAVLDGEIVALDSKGRSSFQLLQSWQNAGAKKPPLLYYVFDLLNADGKDFTGLPLLKRKAIAERLVDSVDPKIRFSTAIKGNLDRLVREMQTRGLEGLIAKRADSKYQPGRRSGEWVKFKWTNEQEFVIGGCTKPQGTRPYFGAILVGYYEKDKLMFAGKVGTGFDQNLLESLYRKFQKLIRSDCPFANLPEKRTQSGGLIASEMKRCTWLEPKLVCQVRFSEWTRDGHLRQPVFVGLREDKKPREVVREGPGRIQQRR